ncbi:MAG: acyltransferase [Sphingomonas sp.]|uniref:acyltransferase n=1 Tax=Sphingomonas sp. TaxID=28214 RepID=UPI0025E2B85B|nr:DapH/DapD/GlmU-related protein [Sphingomonas sp.]MBX9881859.1 acyltransferase [Sphingomonas sp.]
MALGTINRLYKLRRLILEGRRRWLALRHGVVMGENSSISLSGRVVSGGKGSISIGNDSLIAFKTLLVARDMSGRTRPIRIGHRCFIGGGAVVMPGVTIGDGSIVGSGAVVFDDVPPASIAAGNPARVIRQGIEVGKRGQLKGSEQNWPSEIR